MHTVEYPESELLLYYFLLTRCRLISCQYSQCGMCSACAGEVRLWGGQPYINGLDPKANGFPTCGVSKSSTLFFMCFWSVVLSDTFSHSFCCLLSRPCSRARFAQLSKRLIACTTATLFAVGLWPTILILLLATLQRNKHGG